jgi:hypothetical protein
VAASGLPVMAIQFLPWITGFCVFWPLTETNISKKKKNIVCLIFTFLLYYFLWAAISLLITFPTDAFTFFISQIWSRPHVSVSITPDLPVSAYRKVIVLVSFAGHHRLHLSP